MTITEEERNFLIKNYVSKSNATIDKVNFLIDNKEYDLAISRIYYGIYYILFALAIKSEYSTSKHSRLIGWFNQTFVKKNIIDVKYGKIIRKAFENRMEGDYNIFSDFQKEEVMQSFEEMKLVIKKIEELIYK